MSSDRMRKQQCATHWKAGDLCRVKLDGMEYKQVKVLETMQGLDSVHLLCKLEITHTYTDLASARHTTTWIYPELVKSDKLKKRLLED